MDLIRNLYKVTAVLYLLTIAVSLVLNYLALESGRGDKEPFSVQHIAMSLLIISIFVSLYQSRISSGWLWLGVPAVVIYYGMITYLFILLPLL